MRRRGGFAHHGWRCPRPAWIAAVVLAVASLPIGASAGYFAQQAQMCQPREVQLSQYVPEVKQRCRWVKDCQTDFETGAALPAGAAVSDGALLSGSTLFRCAGPASDVLSAAGVQVRHAADSAIS